MRILFDARSVRTAAGKYVFQGLTSAWRHDDRIGAVLAAIPPGFDVGSIPDGIEPVPLAGGNWLHHLTTELPSAADRARADIIFIPNGLPPRDPRAVIYFQDLHQFTALSAPGLSMPDRAAELARSVWRKLAAPTCKLAIPVSTHIHHHVVRRVPIPVTMIPNGVDVGSIRWTGGADCIVVMGGCGMRKGEDVALHAWAHLPSSARRHARLALIGVEPAARRVKLEEVAYQLGLGDSVQIEGGMPRVQFLEWVASSMLAVSCSRLEAFGLPVAEALAMGAPLLASNLPSHRELVARAGAGTLFPTGHATALAKELSAALQGRLPQRLKSFPLGWSWRDRARQHVDAYQNVS